MSSPSASAASRMAWASARFSIHHVCSSVGSSGSMTGSRSRCQPSRHCAARRFLARSAHDGQTDARVCPHGTSTGSVSPVDRSVRRSWTGRMQAPCSTARSLTTSRASGIDSRSALVPLPSSGVGHLASSRFRRRCRRRFQRSDQPQSRHSTTCTGCAVTDQDQPGRADRARLVGAPHDRLSLRPRLTVITGARATATAGHGANVVVGHVRGPDPYRIGRALEPDVADPGPGCG